MDIMRLKNAYPKSPTYRFPVLVKNLHMTWALDVSFLYAVPRNPVKTNIQ